MDKSYSNFQFWKIFLVLEYLIILISAYAYSKSIGYQGVAIPGILGQSDSFFYYNQVVTNAAGLGDLNSSGTAFIPMMTFFSKLFGTSNILLLKLINFIGFLLLVLGISLIINIKKNKININSDIGTNILVRLALFPSAILSVCVPFGRDIWIYVFFMFSTYFGMKIVNKKSIQVSFFLFVISILGLYVFRKYAALSVIIGSIIYLIVNRMSKRQIGFIIIIGLTIFLIWFEFFSGVSIPIVNLSLKDALNFQAGNAVNSLGMVVSQRTGGSDFMGSFDSNNIIIFLGQIVLSYIGNLVGPFVWQVKSIPMILVFIFEAIPMIVTVIKIIIDRKLFANFIRTNSRFLFLFCQLFSWWSMIALTNKNIGTGMRLKIPLFIFIWIIYYCFKKWKKVNER